MANEGRHIQQREADYLQEARTGVITLPESASVIEELLAHLYGVLSPWVDDSSVSLGADELLSLRIAADKVIWTFLVIAFSIRH